MEYFITFPAKLSFFFGSDMAGSHLQRAHRSAPEKQLYFTYGRMRASMRWISSGGI